MHRQTRSCTYSQRPVHLENPPSRNAVAGYVRHSESGKSKGAGRDGVVTATDGVSPYTSIYLAICQVPIPETNVCKQSGGGAERGAVSLKGWNLCTVTSGPGRGRSHRTSWIHFLEPDPQTGSGSVRRMKRQKNPKLLWPGTTDTQPDVWQHNSSSSVTWRHVGYFMLLLLSEII